MIKTIEAIYRDGVLEPLEALPLQQDQRVRITVEVASQAPDADRRAALERLFAGIASMNFRSEGPLPTREELHERR
jgi:predicted DNA-binding antitoxin AbrB/MazE fold protein